MQRKYQYSAALILSALLVIYAFSAAHCSSGAVQDTPAPRVSTDDAKKSGEAAARELVYEGERANEVTDPAGALLLFDKAIAQYPDAEITRFAYVRKAETLVYLDRCDEAIEVARSVVERYPRTKPACWAQYWIGQALLKKGDAVKAVIAFRGVSGMLPNRDDLSPLDYARRALGELSEPHLAKPTDIEKAVSFLGVVGDETRSRAEVYAVIATHLGRDGRIDLGNPILDRFAKECPGEKAELDWARMKVACSYLDSAAADMASSEAAIAMLKPILATSSDDAAVQACLSLARFYRRTNVLDKALEVLQAGRSKLLDTTRGAEILYETGTLIRRMGKSREAKEVFEELLAKKGDSRYALPASMLIKEPIPAKSPTSLDELIKEARESYEPGWIGLASCPKDGRLDDPVIVARQLVALSKDRDAYIELAFDLIDRMAGREGYSEEDAGKAKSRIVHCFLETALAKQESWRDTMGFAYQEAERCRKTGDYDTARHIYSAISDLTGTAADLRAMSMYGLVLCHWDTGLRNAARRLALEVVEQYPDTEGARRAQLALCMWYPETRLTEDGYSMLYTMISGSENRTERKQLVYTYLQHYPDGKYSSRFGHWLQAVDKAEQTANGAR